MTRFVSIFVFLLAAWAGRAQLPVARLLTVFPPGGKSGSEFEVEVAGVDLDEVKRMQFSREGITARLKGTNTFLVSIGTGVTPGVYEARAAGRFGISNPRAFVVGDLPEATGPTTNSSLANAAAMQLGTTINGHSEVNAAGFYKFSAKKGQRVLAECKASEIDSRMDAALVLSDSGGKELKRNRSGGLLDFAAPTDGEYFLKVYDYQFRGGGEYFYRLSVSAGPHIDYVFPPSGVAGTKGKFVLYGSNLPGSVQTNGLEQLEVEIELPREGARSFSAAQKMADATLDVFEFRLGSSNPVLIGLATGPVVLEQAGDGQRISVPCEVVGQFYPARDRDSFVFDGKKGEVFWVEVFSQRLGLPTDPMVVIDRVSKNEKGEEQVSEVKDLKDTDSIMGGAEYNASTRDPSGRFEVDKDGAYRIQVRDLFNTSKSDPRLVYRLSIRKEAPDFRLVAVPQAPPPANKDAKEALLWAPLLRRGETMPIRVMAFRRDNFNGDIELKVENLPAGVTCDEARIEKDKSVAMLLLTAGENAAGWAGPIKIIGKAKIGEADVAREARGATVNWTVGDYNNEAIDARLCRDFALGVSGVESAPISIEAGESKVWEAPAGGKLKVPLKLIRRGEFNANLKLKAVGIGALDKLKEIEVDGKATNATVEIDLAEYKIPAGQHSFYLQTQTAGKYRNNPEAAKAAAAAVKEAEALVVKRMKADKGSTNSLTEAETAFRAAAERLAGARKAWEENPGGAGLRAEKEAAVKAFDEAEMVREGARAAVLLKEARASKELASKRAQEAEKAAAPRDVTVTVYSAPIHLKIVPK